MNKRKLVAIRKHRIKAKKLKERRQAAKGRRPELAEGKRP